MSQTMWIMSAAVVGELLLLLFVLLAVAFVRNRAQARRDRDAVAALVGRIKSARPEREQAITGFLEQVGLAGDTLQHAKVAMLRGEMGLLQRVAGVYRLRDAAAMARINADVYAAFDPYHALSGDGAGSADADGEGQAIVDSSELETLRAENQRLSDELTITMETMSRMLNEYSTMFAPGESDDAAPIAAPVAGAEADGDDIVIDPGDSQAPDRQAELESTDDDHASIEAASLPHGHDEQSADPAADDDIVIAERVDDAGDELPEPVAPPLADDDPGGTAEQTDELFDVAADSDADGSDEAGDVDATGEDEIAEILEQAASQEDAARQAVPSGSDADAVPFEEGPSEIVAFDDAQAEDVITADELDDLFDAAIADEEAQAAESDAADEESLQSGSGG